MKSRILTAPVLLPDTPDCDIANGEPVLSAKKVKQLQTSYKHYQIVDLEHDFTKTLKQRGSVLNSWLTETPVSVKTEDGNTITYPRGTWFLTTRITDPEAIKLYDSGKLTGYSLTTLDKTSANKFKL